MTVSAMVAVAVNAPEVPVIVTVTGPPAVAALLAVSVRTLELLAGLVPNDAVTPLGNVDVTASWTLPANPAMSLTVMVSVLLPPWATESVCDAGERVKPAPTPFTVTVPVLPS